MPESIGPLRWRLEVPHLGLADYRRLQRLGLRQQARRSTPKSFAIGFAIGGVIGALVVLAAAYWNIWMDSSMAVGIGRRRLLVLEDDAFWCVVLAVAVAIGLCTVVNYRMLVRRIYDTSRRKMSSWSLEVGEDGLRMVWNEVMMTVPWSKLHSVRSNATATFLTVDAYITAVGISHTGFTTDADREACLAFLKAKIPASSP
jgi:hypothetical protein